MSIEKDTTRRIPRCFMTGRICIHESEIKKRLDEMKRNEQEGKRGQIYFEIATSNILQNQLIINFTLPTIHSKFKKSLLPPEI